MRLPFDRSEANLSPDGAVAQRPRSWMPSLTDPAATDPEQVGAKAAALASAASFGLPVLPGLVLRTLATDAITRAGGLLPDDILAALRVAFEDLSEAGTRPLVVRSSSTAEDGAMSSMAGMFTSVLDVRDWQGFQDAVLEVIGSAGVLDSQGNRTPAPMAVLIQPQLASVKGGILFGVDPVSGDPKRFAVAATDGGPDALVSGRTDGTHLLMDHTGRPATKDKAALALLRASERRALARLARSAAEHFGGPQDIEWGFDRAGTLHLFQSRPVTSVGARATGPVMGPGPVAETFPDPLSALEADLWVRPLHFAVAEAMAIAGAGSKRALRESPVVTTTGGRVAADLELFGIRTRKKSLWTAVDPRGPARRMLAAWRVGRLRSALPAIAQAASDRVDRDLAALPAISQMTTDQLLTILSSTQAYLRALHGYEILSGLLDIPDGDDVTGAELGLRALTMARRIGTSDRDTVARHPEVLALAPPSVCPQIELPATSTLASGAPRSIEELGPREALRLRIRWVQELAARSAWELGVQAASDDLLDSPDQVRLLSLSELEDVIGRRHRPDDLPERAVPTTPPLPAAFRIAEDGSPVPVASTGPNDGARGAGGGRGMGKVHQGRDPEPGQVLVVGTLDPSLAAVLPRLGGLVAETGSVLSHLAILAREFGVPTVVGFAGALDRFPEGSVVIVDGSTGEVAEVSEA